MRSDLRSKQKRGHNLQKGEAAGPRYSRGFNVRHRLNGMQVAS